MKNSISNSILLVLIFQIIVDQINISEEPISLAQVKEELNYMSLSESGKWKPENCKPKFRTAIIVPYLAKKSRKHHLGTFPRHTHRFLSHQLLDYGIYLVQPATLPFKKGVLYNAGFKEALKDEDWNCFFFMDIDMLPENENNIFECNVTHPGNLAWLRSDKNYT
jgi:hypothetical protein